MRNFNLKQVQQGKPCCTIDDQWMAEFLFIGQGLAPLVMMIGGCDIENYTTDGRHLIDENLNLKMEYFGTYMDESPTAKYYTIAMKEVHVVPRTLLNPLNIKMKPYRQLVVQLNLFSHA